MAEWSEAFSCPKCGSKETRFIEPHYEMSVYECLSCGSRFEIEEQE
jgi:DNA-directed RNA polymerase subunit RPC12/RpoP